jgi:hypothetical protein
MTPVELLPTNETVLLDAEDRRRMTRLYEEVLTRIEEMAMITARTLGTSPAGAGDVLFRPFGSGHAVEVLRGADATGCYDYLQGSCFEFHPQTKTSD